ncbi:DUF1120 domain-containing protein [Pseudomonas sp. 09C 129]|jgi:type 1 fimbria pilin|uniref:DUF1120 domain-containing protein n=1 Tax=Pseudomonas chlororaphis TaxID=587753 RepID=A0AB34C149_9PSED|nr:MULTISPECIES: DUF1120 domain-containing protein [Pseudomonas]AUG03313.1 DUF1120 domain-containing protein [Pseudomonas sp. 09C 129]EZP32987.1 hypothetical protein BW33_01254 [Pseudomonas sp. RIT288]KAA5839256.1 DUF1120 domain-containing protein [Pseudomonas chlororaphis]PMY30930.1 DUF1120 domain-containing protein [Pseudomonas sp. GW456-L14]PMY48367.1 DUF1120 domain-containing protein [Pseudomonas sp. GW456-L12]
MSFPKKTLLGSLLLLSATSAFAVDTADLRVIGTIAPTACTPTFAGGGTINYGLIPGASLSATAETALAVRTISYTITCNAPIRIGMSWTDSRRDSTVRAPYNGLGKHMGANIGFFLMTPVPAGTTADGASVDLISRTNDTAAWVLASAISPIVPDGVRTHSYAPKGTLVPGAYSNYAGTINVLSVIAPTSTLDMTRSVTLDGLTTMIVRYL